jgi:hypothetical protein
MRATGKENREIASGELAALAIAVRAKAADCRVPLSPLCITILNLLRATHKFFTTEAQRHGGAFVGITARVRVKVI